jgi:hypothetical protein
MRSTDLLLLIPNILHNVAIVNDEPSSFTTLSKSSWDYSTKVLCIWIWIRVALQTSERKSRPRHYCVPPHHRSMLRPSERRWLDFRKLNYLPFWRLCISGHNTKLSTDISTYCKVFEFIRHMDDQLWLFLTQTHCFNTVQFNSLSADKILAFFSPKKSNRDVSQNQRINPHKQQGHLFLCSRHNDTLPSTNNDNSQVCQRVRCAMTSSRSLRYLPSCENVSSINQSSHKFTFLWGPKSFCFFWTILFFCLILRVSSDSLRHWRFWCYFIFHSVTFSESLTDKT